MTTPVRTSKQNLQQCKQPLVCLHDVEMTVGKRQGKIELIAAAYCLAAPTKKWKFSQQGKKER